MKNQLLSAIYIFITLFAALQSSAGTHQLMHPTINKTNSQGRLLEADTAWRWDGRAFSTYRSNYHYAYDNQNRETNFIWQLYNNNAWVNREQHITSYANDTTVTTWQDWTNNAWENHLRFTFVFDGQGNELSMMAQAWTNNAWDISYRYLYTYDNQNRATLVTSELWTNNAWVYHGKDTSIYTYNSDNDLTILLTQTDNAGTWENQHQDVYSYTNHLKQTYESQDWYNNAWSTQERHVYNYDANNHAVVDSDQTVSGTLVNDTWLTLHYDSYNDTDYVISRIFDNGSWGVYDSTHLYYRNAVGVEVVGHDEFTVSIYPNPCTDIANISVDAATALPFTVTMFDIAGKVMQKRECTDIHSKVDVTQFSPGIYHLLLIDSKGNSITKKIVKE